MKAMMLWGLNEPLQPLDWNWGMDIKPEECQIDLVASSLNHRDIWITKGLYAGIVFPTILGSDGAGILDDREVIINPALFWGDTSSVQSPGFQVLGMPVHGTFAENIRIRHEYVYDKPEHLSFEEAAALPLAGLTAYRALFTKVKLAPSDKVLISGVGGGVATLAFQFALTVGCEVWVTSSHNWKLEESIRMGASGVANYTDENWSAELKKQTGGFDVIIDSAAGNSFQELVSLANPGGRISLYGGTRGKINGLSPQMIFWKQLTICGSTMGSPEDFSEMLGFVKNHQFKPRIDSVFPLSKANEAIQYLSEGKQFGKVVLKNRS